MLPMVLREDGVATYLACCPIALMLGWCIAQFHLRGPCLVAVVFASQTIEIQMVRFNLRHTGTHDLGLTQQVKQLGKTAKLPLAIFCLLVGQSRQVIAADLVVDVLLAGGNVIDGTGAPARQADVAINNGQIVIPASEDTVKPTWRIDCRGLVVCPGFIDLHNHSDGEVDVAGTRAAMNYVTQGCTTMVTGNCGSGPINVRNYYDKIDEHGAGTNIAHLIPQGGLRKAILKSERVEVTASQLQEMQDLADVGMDDGAWGMSTGLIYVPSSYASTSELTAIAEIVGNHGGIYASHIRGEGTNLLESIEEALEIGRNADLPVHISHFKAAGRSAWGLVREATRKIEEQRALGYEITADQYPYIASSTSLGATVLPSWAREGGGKELRKRLVSDRDQMIQLISKAIEKAERGKSIRLARYGAAPQWVGMNLAAIAELTQRPVVDVAVEILMNGDASVVKFSMNEQDVRHVMRHDWVATASDGSAKLPGATKPHPRNYGTFPRKLAHYSIAEKVITLEDAIRSMTGLPAKILSMKDRGLLQAGLAADITVFDPNAIRDTATFDDPHQYAVGIRYVFVNGQPAVVKGKPTGTLAGKSLRFSGRGK